VRALQYSLRQVHNDATLLLPAPCPSLLPSHVSMARLLSEELWFLVFEQVLGPCEPYNYATAAPDPFALPGREPILPLMLVCRQWQVREVQQCFIVQKLKQL
jgi:hypothetical protein